MVNTKFKFIASQIKPSIYIGILDPNCLNAVLMGSHCTFEIGQGSVFCIKKERPDDD